MKAIINTKPATTDIFDNYLKEILANDLKAFKSGRGRFLQNNSTRHRNTLIA